MLQPTFSFGEQWKGRCFLCNRVYESYSTGNLLCQSCADDPQGYRNEYFFNSLHPSKLSHYFVTVLPEAEDFDRKTLKHGFSDVFLKVRDKKNQGAKKLLKNIFPSLLPIPCGQPSLVKMPYLAEFSGFGGVWCLDMSPYIWSGTYKDLRSWAILSKAVEHNVKHLVLWTAGNAGFSLAKMVHRYNATVPDNDKKTVYCLMDASAPPEVVVTLRSLQCRVAPISTGEATILSKEHLYNVVASLTKTNLQQERYWHVTDGWDGIGVFMYSLLAEQTLNLLKGEMEQTENLRNADIYILLPLGTGNFLLGFFTAMERVSEGRGKVVAAMPYGDNMMMSFRKPPEEEKKPGRPKMVRDDPEAAKLTGFYSPFSPILAKMDKNADFARKDSVEFIEVDRAEQIESASRILGISEQVIAAEPSALIAFGALKSLSEKTGNNAEQNVVLVVNSGFGLMGIREQQFFTESIFAFR